MIHRVYHVDDMCEDDYIPANHVGGDAANGTSNHPRSIFLTDTIFFLDSNQLLLS